MNAPWSALVWYHRSAGYLIDIAAWEMIAGPSVETVFRGIYRDTRDLPWALHLFEAPAATAAEAQAIFTDPLIAADLVQIQFCSVATGYAEQSGEPGGSVYRPFFVPEQGEKQWRWLWFANAKEYRQRVAHAIDSGRWPLPAEKPL